MIARFIVTAVIAASLFSVPAFAQTSAELLQKGIYLQETAGDLDGAIQVYRQIVVSASNQPVIASQAQFRLTQSLLQKGDLAGAAREFETLVRNYPDQTDLVNTMGQRLRTIAENGPTQLLGSFQNGKYHHYWTGVQLTAPAGWSFTSQRANPDGFDRVDLADPSGKAVSAVVVMTEATVAESIPAAYHIGMPPPPGWRVTMAGGETTATFDTRPANKFTPADIAEELQTRLKRKLNQRGDAAGYHGYAYRPDSIRTTTVAGQQALSAIGDYTDDKGTKMSEYLTFVQSDKTKMFFSVTSAAADLPDVMARFGAILSTAVIP